MRRIGIQLGLGLCAALALAAPALRADASQAGARSPRLNYVLHCQGCHLPDGSGQPGKVPAIRGHLARFLEVPGGRAYIVQVPGVATSKLTNAETAELMNWLVTEMGPRVPADFKPYTPAEITSLRAHWLVQPAPVRVALIKSMSANRAND